MKIILSRKGFDSAYGGCPSPIDPDGRMLSLPIPSSAGDSRDALPVPVRDALATFAKADAQTFHLDPQLERPPGPQYTGWMPNLGQAARAQSHLANNHVGPGDLFLFFGLFRHAELREGRLQFTRGSRPVHAFFGWLQIAEVLAIYDASSIARRRPWLADHPHVRHHSHFKKSNTLYIGSDRTTLSGHEVASTSGGLLGWSPELQLTAPAGRLLTEWALPSWLTSQQHITKPITYFGNLDRWSNHDGQAHVKSPSRGQEFVLDASSFPEAIPWAISIIQHRREL